MFRIVPQLTVRDVRASACFYAERLGFRVSVEDPPGSPEFVALEREDAALFLVSVNSREEGAPGVTPAAARGAGVRLYMEVDDAQEVYEALHAAGVPILRDIAHNEEEDYTEFSFQDPDGYQIGIYS